MDRRAALGLIALAAAGGGAWYLTRGGAGDGLPDMAAAAQDASAVDTSSVTVMTMGKEDAPVKVVEYASFTCPHCKHFHDVAWKDFKKNYIDTGKVHFEFREFYLNKFDLWAGLMARCGGDMRYFGIVDILYDTQSDWVGDGDPAKIAANLTKIGKTAGISDEQLKACMDDADQAKAMVALFQKNATADEVTGTPTFFVNGERHSNMEYDELARVLDAELSKS